MQSGIYQIKNNVNGKVYVGQTVNFAHRKRQHFKALKENTHYNQYLQRSFNKYGQAGFSFEVIEECLPEFLNERERYWIQAKQSEYAEKGYNAAYAVALFNHYDKHKQVNKSERTSNVAVMHTADAKLKAREGINKHWENNKEARLNVSSQRRSLDDIEIYFVKQRLAYDFMTSTKQIAYELGIDHATVTHIAQGKTYTLYYSELNQLIKTREERAKHKTDKLMIKLWCDGKPSTEIGKAVGLHYRNVITRLHKLRSKYTDRCRLNVINRAEQRCFSQVHRLKAMGYNKMQVHLLLGYGRNYISNVWNESQSKQYFTSESTRGIHKPFRLKVG